MRGHLGVYRTGAIGARTRGIIVSTPGTVTSISTPSTTVRGRGAIAATGTGVSVEPARSAHAVESGHPAFDQSTAPRLRRDKRKRTRPGIRSAGLPTPDSRD